MLGADATRVYVALLCSRVRDVTIPLDGQVCVGPGEELFEVVRAIGESPAGRVLVVGDDGRLLGIVTTRDVTTWMALRGGARAVLAGAR